MSVDSQIVIGAFVIFLLRVVGMSVSTLRMLVMIQGRRLVSIALGFIESLLFAVALGAVVTQLDNIWNLLAYCLGFSAGIYVGMLVEGRVIVNFMTVNIVSPEQAEKIADAIRQLGFGATISWGQGVAGQVGSVRVVCQRRDVKSVTVCVQQIDGDAFITLDETRAVRHGYLPAHRRAH